MLKEFIIIREVVMVQPINIMDQENTALGLATMCIGSGQGIATIIEKIN